MPLVTTGPMLRNARSAGYGIAAINMIDFNSVRSIVGGAVASDAPVIVQVSGKTLRHWGHRPIADWVARLAGDAEVPVGFHLDHCSDVDTIRRCIDVGWTSVMFDGSALPFEANLEKSIEVYRLTESAGVGLEVEIGAIGGVEDDKRVAEGEEALASIEECAAFAKAMPNLAAIAPAIGTAHGAYKGEPRLAYDLLERIGEATELPVALHGGTGLSPEQFRRCIAGGCAKINIATAHRHRYIESFLAIAEREPDGEDPLSFITGQFEAMKDDVRAKIDIFGSAGKARHAAGGQLG